ncbi:MAG: carbohydrate kinase family protein [Patescibacteria group bacterium]
MNLLKFDVVSIGSASLDVFFQSSHFQLVEKDGGVVLCERFNEKIEVEKSMISSGGAATNTAVGFARLGLQTACIAEIGQDIGGKVVLQELQREGVDISHMVKESNEETGISGLLISQDGARTALVHRGAAGMLTVNDLDLDAIEAKWIHLSSIGNLELIAHIFDVCAQKHIKLSWNPGNWEIDQMVSGQLKPAWDVVEILFVNRKEMAQLGNMDLADETVWKSDWCFVGPKISVATDGKNGGRYCVDGGCHWYDGIPVAVVQETGAGDAFASGVVAGLLMNKNIEQSIEIGGKNAAFVVGHLGAKTGLLTKEKLAL